MPKKRKKEIILSKDSVLALMQEIYNELVEQRATAVRLMNKMMNLIKDADDITIVGPVIKEQQKLINDAIEKKLTLSKLQSTIWEKQKNSQEDEKGFNLSDIDFDDEKFTKLLNTKTGDDKGKSGYKLD